VNPSVWTSTENLTLLNPRLPTEDQASLRRALDYGQESAALNGHVFLLTSGTTAATNESLSAFKWVALSKTAILNAAEAANRHLESGAHDVWLHCLPEFHIGGLSIWARSTLSGARVVKSVCAQAWVPEKFVDEVAETRATLCSLVPAHVHDLITRELRAPSSLRAILLGGGASSRELLSRARALGWPVLPTYGMSETASQVATALLNFESDRNPPLRILSHLDVSTGEDERLRIRGSSLLTGYIRVTSDGRGMFVDPKEKGWFVTDDFGKVENGTLTLLGRVSDRIKIGGETVHLSRLEALLEEEASRLKIAPSLTLVASPDPRLESVIHAVCEERCEPAKAREAVERYNRRVLPFERAREIRIVPTIPRTELWKIKRAELRALMGEPSL